MTRVPSLRQLGPLSVRADSAPHAIADIVQAIEARRGVRVAFANTHLLYCALTDEGTSDALGSFTILNDGIGLALLARLACGDGFPENLNGTDFVPRLLDCAPAETRIYLYGARTDVVHVAAAHLARRHPHLAVCGRRDGHTTTPDDRALLHEIAALAPDIVLVALGNPLQEKWIERASRQMPGTTFIAVGALFDFMAGASPRAPRWLQAARLEWLFRFLQEPQRLWRRYSTEIVVIVVELLRARMRMDRRHRAPS